MFEDLVGKAKSESPLHKVKAGSDCRVVTSINDICIEVQDLSSCAEIRLSSKGVDVRAMCLHETLSEPGKVLDFKAIVQPVFDSK